MKIIKNSPIINSAIKAWNGEEKLWKVFWLWGVLFYVGSIFIGISVMVMYFWEPTLSKSFFLLVQLMVGLIMFCCGIVMMVIYPTILLFSMNRCSRNISLNSKKIREAIVFFSKLFPFPFMILHSFYAFFVGFGSILFLSRLIEEIKDKNYIISGISLLMFFNLFVIFIINLKKCINNSNLKALNIKSLNNQQNIKPSSKLLIWLLLSFSFVSFVLIILIYLTILIEASFGDKKEGTEIIIASLFGPASLSLSLILYLIFILKTCCRKIIINSINKN